MWVHILYNVLVKKIPQWGIEMIGGISMTNIEIKVNGKYAEQRRTVLENHAPDMYEAMLSDCSLESHLANIQETVSRYVESRVEAYKASEEYLVIEKVDCFEAMRLLNTTVLEAEDSAYRMWIASIPEDEEEYD